MFVKIVDIHQMIQQIIMNILKFYIHILHFYIVIMIKDNLNSIQIHLQHHHHHHQIIIWNRIKNIYFLS